MNELTYNQIVSKTPAQITFARLAEISPDALVAHMSDPRMAMHMPLQTFAWDLAVAARFVSEKEDGWRRDGLGHWAILCDGQYVGWGGFQKEGEEWDFGLVLKPDAFGLGVRITRKAIAFARADARIPFVTFLLPPSRRNLGALARLGACFVAEVEHGGATFRKYRLETRQGRETNGAQLDATTNVGVDSVHSSIAEIGGAAATTSPMIIGSRADCPGLDR